MGVCSRQPGLLLPHVWSHGAVQPYAGKLCRFYWAWTELSLNSNITLFHTCRRISENRWNLCLSTLQILQVGQMCHKDILTSKSCTYRDDKCLDLLSSLYTLYSCLPICRYNQVNALRVACSTGLKNCTDLVNGWFQQWMNNPDVNPWVSISSK